MGHGRGLARISFEDSDCDTFRIRNEPKQKSDRMLQSSKDTKCHLPPATCDLRPATYELWPTRQLALTEKQLDCSCPKTNKTRPAMGGGSDGVNDLCIGCTWSER